MALLIRGNNPKRVATSILWTIMTILTIAESQQVKNSTIHKNEVSCKITKGDDGLLNFSGNGTYIIETVVGTGEMDYNLITKSFFFGPIQVRNDTCNQMIESNPICYDHSSDSGLYNVPCKNKLNSLSVFVISLCIFLTILEIVIVRYFYITKWFKLPGFTLLSINELDGCWYYRFVNEDTVKVLFSKEGTKNKKTEYSPSNGNEFISLKIEKRKMFLFFLFLCRPTNTFEHNINSVTHSTMTDITMELQEGDHIYLGNFSLSIEKARRIHPITYLYDTFNYSTYMDSDWHCSDKSCNSHGSCGIGGSTGVFDGDVAWEMMKDNLLHYYRRFCNWGSTGCFLHSGCYMWFIDIQMNRDYMASVFDIGQAIQDTKINTNSNDDCFIRYTSETTPTFVNKWTHVRFLDVDYICPVEDNHRNPLKGTLGDLQMSKDWKMAMDPSIFSCVHTYERGPSCNVIQSSLNSVIKRCTSIPNYVGSSKFYKEGDYIVEESGNSVSVTLSCERSSISKITNDTCGGVSYSLYGREKSSDGVTIVIRPKIINEHGIWKGVIPCSSELVIMPCNSDGLHVKVPWPSKCLMALNLDTSLIMREEEMSNYKELALGSITQSEMNYNNDLWASTMSLGWHLSTIPLPIIGLIIIIILRR